VSRGSLRKDRAEPADVVSGAVVGDADAFVGLQVVGDIEGDVVGGLDGNDVGEDNVGRDFVGDFDE
jgi:hypothetical protein